MQEVVLSYIVPVLLIPVLCNSVLPVARNNLGGPHWIKHWGEGNRKLLHIFPRKSWKGKDKLVKYIQKVLILPIKSKLQKTYWHWNLPRTSEIKLPSLQSNTSPLICMSYTKYWMLIIKWKWAIFSLSQTGACMVTYTSWWNSSWKWLQNPTLLCHEVDRKVELFT